MFKLPQIIGTGGEKSCFGQRLHMGFKREYRIKIIPRLRALLKGVTKVLPMKVGAGLREVSNVFVPI